jgi:hypothetical protein
MNLPVSQLTKNQKKEFNFEIEEGGRRKLLQVELRHDDECGNGHNSFAITGAIYPGLRQADKYLESCGCLHDEIALHAPQLKPLIKWHLTSTDGPMHYLANTLYWLAVARGVKKYGETQDRAKAFAHAKSCAVWDDMPEELIDQDEHAQADALTARLEELMHELKAAIESQGMVY